MSYIDLKLEERILYDMYFEFQKDEYFDCKNIEEKIIEKIFEKYIDEESIRKMITENEYNFIKKSKSPQKIFRKLGEEKSHFLKIINECEKYPIIKFIDFSEYEIKFLLNINHPLILPRTIDSNYKYYVNNIKELNDLYKNELDNYYETKKRLMIRILNTEIEINNKIYSFDDIYTTIFKKADISDNTTKNIEIDRKKIHKIYIRETVKFNNEFLDFCRNKYQHLIEKYKRENIKNLEEKLLLLDLDLSKEKKVIDAKITYLKKSYGRLEKIIKLIEEKSDIEHYKFFS